MRKVTTYIACDGAQFDDEFECIAYENAFARAEEAAHYFEGKGIPARKVAEYERVIRDWLVSYMPAEPNPNELGEDMNEPPREEPFAPGEAA